MIFYRTEVVGTVRQIEGDRNSAITHLVLATGSVPYQLAELKQAADQDLLWVRARALGRNVNVQIFWNDHLRKLVARTDGDSIYLNNLDELPIYRLPGRDRHLGL